MLDATELDAAAQYLEPEPDADGLVSWSQWRTYAAEMAGLIREYQGIPIPLPGLDLQLEVFHPMAGVREALTLNPPPQPDTNEWRRKQRERERVRHMWHDRQRNRYVFIVERSNFIFSEQVPLSPDRSMERLDLQLGTVGATDAWEPAAEAQARRTLRDLLSERQWNHYDLCGAFFETSERSRVTYVVRRLRPTIAMAPFYRDGRENERMRCLTVLCLHPVGYYRKTWAGALCPSDDVIAHLLWIRGDEAGFWRRATHHLPSDAEAGL